MPHRKTKKVKGRSRKLPIKILPVLARPPVKIPKRVKR